jgi:putative nucleotidyltransferase with HDIG domain
MFKLVILKLKHSMKLRLIRVMKEGELSQLIREMDTNESLSDVFPEMLYMKNCFHDQNQPYHREGNGEVWVHALMVLDNAKKGVIPQLAALYHDFGKPTTRTVQENGRVRFFKHEEVSAIMAEKSMRELKFDDEIIQKVSRLVKMHSRPHAFGRSEGKQPSNKSLRKFLRYVGDDLDDLLDLSEADTLGNIRGNGKAHNYIPEFRERISKYTNKID